MAAHKVYTNIFNYSQIPKSINFHYFQVAVFFRKKNCRKLTKKGMMQGMYLIAYMYMTLIFM